MKLSDNGLTKLLESPQQIRHKHGGFVHENGTLVAASFPDHGFVVAVKNGRDTTLIEFSNEEFALALEHWKMRA